MFDCGGYLGFPIGTNHKLMMDHYLFIHA